MIQFMTEQCYYRNDIPQEMIDEILSETGHSFMIPAGDNPMADAVSKYAQYITTNEQDAYINPTTNESQWAYYKAVTKKWIKPEEITKWYLKKIGFLTKKLLSLK